MASCKCGCGSVLPGGKPRYLNGHTPRLPCACGCGELAEIRHAYIAGHKRKPTRGFSGRKHTNEAKERIGASGIAYWADRERPPVSQETRTKMRVARRKPIEELSYFGWHRWQLSEFPKTGFCVTCQEPGVPHAANKIGTQWSYIGDDPNGWEPDHAKYIEECTRCNLVRSPRSFEQLSAAGKLGAAAKWAEYVPDQTPLICDVCGKGPFKGPLGLAVHTGQMHS